MASLDTIDQLLAALRQPTPIYKASVGSAVAGGMQSLWTATGMPVAGATPATGSGAAANSATAGAIAIPTLNTGETLYLAGSSMAQATVGTLILIDRLVHTSGLNGTLNTAQTVNTTALPRYTTGDQVEAALEWYTATGATGVTYTVSYTNQAGTAGRTSVAASIPANTGAARFIPLGGLQSGDTGVRSVESVTLSATTATAGNFGVTLFRRIAQWPVLLANTGHIYDALSQKTALADAGASQPCLALLMQCSTTSTGLILPTISFAVR